MLMGPSSSLTLCECSIVELAPEGVYQSTARELDSGTVPDHCHTFIDQVRPTRPNVSTTCMQSVKIHLLSSMRLL